MKKSILFFSLLLLNQTIFNNETSFTKAEKKKFRCTHLYGSSLDECLKEIACQEYKENLEALDDGQRNNHVKRVLSDNDTKNYGKLFGAFSDEEWDTFYSSLSPELQQQLPRNKDQQVEFLTSIMIQAQFKGYLPQTKKDFAYLGVGIVAGVVINAYGGPVLKAIYDKFSPTPISV